MYTIPLASTKKSCTTSLISQVTIEQCFEAKGRLAKGESTNQIICDLFERHGFEIPERDEQHRGWMGQRMHALHKRIVRLQMEDPDEFNRLAAQYGFPKKPVPPADNAENRRAEAENKT